MRDSLSDRRAAVGNLSRALRRTRSRRRRAVLLAGALAAGWLCALGLVALTNSDPPGPTGLPGEHSVDASLFATGACEELAPTVGDRHLVVFLDAGHGGPDPGAVGVTQSGATIYEADETLPVELDAANVLRAAGFTVVESRTADTPVAKLGPQDVSGSELSLQGAHDDVAARDVCANLAGADLLVGIYFDAGSTSSDAGCVTAYDTARPFSSDNQHLAELVQSDVLGALNARGWAIPNQGAVPDTGLGSVSGAGSGSALAQEAEEYDHLLLLGPAEAGFFSTPSQMPGVVVEPLYITDPFEGSIAASPSGQQVIAGGIAEAVEQFFAPPPAGRQT